MKRETHKKIGLITILFFVAMLVLDTPAWTDELTIQVFATSGKIRAEKMVRKLEAKGYAAYFTESMKGDSVLYRVRLGKFGTKKAAQEYLSNIRGELSKLALKPYIITKYETHENKPNRVGRVAQIAYPDRSGKDKEKPEVFVQLGHLNKVNSVAFSPDGRLALSGSRDNTLRLWDVASGKEIRAFHGHSDVVKFVEFSPDGRLALSGSRDNTLRLWDVASGKEIRTFDGHSDGVWSVEFSPDGQLALSEIGAHTLRLWDVASGKEIQVFHGPSSWVGGVRFSPDGRLVLSIGEVGEESPRTLLLLWDVASGKQIQAFNSYYNVAFSPDGRLALSGVLYLS